MRVSHALCTLLWALAGCALDDENDVADDPDELVFMPESKGDGQRRPEGTQLVYVNFDGAHVSSCDDCSDAIAGRSWGLDDLFGKSEVDLAPYQNESAKPTIVAKLRAFYSGYDVELTTERPAEGAYTMVIISPTWATSHGAAPLDCGNQNPSNIAFVNKIGTYSADLIARYAAHELGHSFGLAHVSNSADIMQWASSGRSFTRATYDASHPSGKCMSGTLQDAPSILMENLGRVERPFSSRVRPRAFTFTFKHRFGVDFIVVASHPHEIVSTIGGHARMLAQLARFGVRPRR